MAGQGYRAVMFYLVQRTDANPLENLGGFAGLQNRVSKPFAPLKRPQFTKTFVALTIGAWHGQAHGKSPEPLYLWGFAAPHPA